MSRKASPAHTGLLKGHSRAGSLQQYVVGLTAEEPEHEARGRRGGGEGRGGAERREEDEEEARLERQPLPAVVDHDAAAVDDREVEHPQRRGQGAAHHRAAELQQRQQHAEPRDQLQLAVVEGPAGVGLERGEDRCGPAAGREG
eukprot:COSAG04_NODE_8995_length_909_cov_1.137037_1_plen_143_part_10